MTPVVPAAGWVDDEPKLKDGVGLVVGAAPVMLIDGFAGAAGLAPKLPNLLSVGCRSWCVPYSHDECGKR
jgi:hypothetical protein